MRFEVAEVREVEKLRGRCGRHRARALGRGSPLWRLLHGLATEVPRLTGDMIDHTAYSIFNTTSANGQETDSVFGGSPWCDPLYEFTLRAGFRGPSQDRVKV